MSRERIFDVDGLQFAAQEWGEQGGVPVLALHGWLDNSASFTTLAPQLKGLHMFALDLAGHGQSSHRPGGAPYNIWEDVAEIFAIADQLQWSEFALLGHSRGAIISLLAAGTFPKRISRLALIEGLWPEPAPIAEAPEQLARSILGVRAQANKPLRMYPSLELATRARAQGMFPLSQMAANALTLRGVKAVAGGYQWSTDQRLLAPSAIKLSREHMQAFVARIQAPIKLILGEEGVPRIFPHYRDELPMFSQLELVVLPGGHHLHMEAQAEQVAAAINSFLPVSRN
jgi:pimeloyl-ACP methyl ester carboxylesterase